MSMSVQVRGLDELRAQLRAGKALVEKRITQFVDGGLADAKRAMVDATPRKTGTLAAGWHIEVRGVFARALTNEVPYAAPVMFGARPHAIPRAFGRPLPFGTSPTFHPGNRENAAMITAMAGADLTLREDWSREGEKIAFALVGKTP